MTRFLKHRCISIRPDGTECNDTVAHKGERCDNCWLSLAKSQITAHRIELAREPEIPERIARLLSVDVFPNVRAAIASRTDIDVEVLVQMAEDPDPAVVREVASNPRTPALSLAFIAKRHIKDIYVLRALSANISTPAKTLENLSDHEDPTVAKIAKERLDGMTTIHRPWYD